MSFARCYYIHVPLNIIFRSKLNLEEDSFEDNTMSCRKDVVKEIYNFWNIPGTSSGIGQLLMSEVKRLAPLNIALIDSTRIDTELYYTTWQKGACVQLLERVVEKSSRCS